MSHDNLEDFIRQHRESFDEEAPSPTVWQRIEAGMSSSEEDDGSDPLGAFIAKHREEFDLATPPPQLAAKLFDGNPWKRKTARRRRLLSYALGIAASMLLLFTVYRFGNEAGFEAGREEERVAQQLEKMNPELAEATRFYQQRISNEFAKVSQVNNDPQLREDLAAIDKATAEIRAELLEVPASQRQVLVNQLISTYRTKLEILLRIQQHLPHPNHSGSPAAAPNTTLHES